MVTKRFMLGCATVVVSSLFIGMGIARAKEAFEIIAYAIGVAVFLTSATTAALVINGRIRIRGILN